MSARIFFHRLSRSVPGVTVGGLSISLVLINLTASARKRINGSWCNDLRASSSLALLHFLHDAGLGLCGRHCVVQVGAELSGLSPFSNRRRIEHPSSVCWGSHVRSLSDYGVRPRDGFPAHGAYPQLTVVLISLDECMRWSL